MASGEDVVTVVEAAELLHVAPPALLDPAGVAGLPRPLHGEGRYQLWRRKDIAALADARAAGG